MTIEQKMALEVLVAAWDNFKFQASCTELGPDGEETKESVELGRATSAVEDGMIQLLDLKGE